MSWISKLLSPPHERWVTQFEKRGVEASLFGLHSMDKTGSVFIQQEIFSGDLLAYFKIGGHFIAVDLDKAMAIRAATVSTGIGKVAG